AADDDRSWLARGSRTSPKLQSDFFYTIASFESKALFLAFADDAAKVLVRDLDQRWAETDNALSVLLAHAAPAVRTSLEAALVAALGDKRRKNGAAFALRAAEARGATLSPSAQAAVSKWPRLAATKAPTKAWLRDGVLTAQLFFYPDERSHGV